MRNSRRPFFYKEKKKIWPKVLIFIVILAVFVFWGSRVPQVRQTVGSYAIDTGMYMKSLIRPVHTPDPQQFRLPAAYPTLELPSEEVVFAENLAEIAEANLSTDPDIIPTATPGVAWIIEEPSATFEPGAGEIEESAPAVMILEPVFERRDYQNDGPAALSALLRHLGEHESQYLISAAVKPNYFDPNVSLQEMADYVSTTYPEFNSLARINGNETLLVNLLQADLQVVIRVSIERDFAAWKGDDLWDGRYLLLTGFDAAKKVFFYIDPVKGNGQSIPFDDLMASWYAFLREYLILFSDEQESDVQRILNEDYPEAANLNNALIKFQRDAEMAPENIFTLLNTATVLVEKERYEEAWNLFQAARNVGLPQRYLLYNPALYTAAFHSGNADILTAYADFSLTINPYSEESHLWKGWGHLLRAEPETAIQSFRKALAIRPNYQEAQYALRFLQSGLN